MAIEPQHDMDPFPELRGEHADSQPHVITADEARREAARISARPLYPEVTVHLSTGHDGNIGAILGTVRDAFRQAGIPDYTTVVSIMWAEIFLAESYDESLRIVMKYAEVA